jgi:predicted porin
MNKKILVAAIAAVVAIPTVVNAEAILYGNVRVASQYHNRSGVANVSDAWGLEDQVSRLGVKGDEDLGNGLKAIYKMEFAVNVGDGCADAKAPCGSHGSPTQRNAYVGLAGNFGTVLAGRHDTPFKISTAKLDFFSDTNVDNDDQNSFGATDSSRGVGLFDSLRVDGAIAYISPDIAGFTLAGAAVQKSTHANFDQADDFAGAYSLAGMYSNGPWYASLAYETIKPDSLIGATGLPDYNKWRAGVGMLGFHNFSAAFIYEDRSDTYFTRDGDSISWQLSAAYDLGNTRLKAMYGEFDGKNALNSQDFDTWAVGLQHSLSKRTDVEVLYRQKDIKDIKGVQVNADDDVFAVQLNHAF